MIDQNMIMVFGCGTMGSGIISSFLTNPSLKITIVENNIPILKKLPQFIQDSHLQALQQTGEVIVNDRLMVLTDLINYKQKKYYPRLIVEAIPEKLALKKALFEKLEEMFPREVIVGSNTSTLPLQQMADWFKYPERFVGIHYNHPAHIIPIVEVVKLAHTDQQYVDQVIVLLKQSGKIPVLLKKPIDGFITNRLQHAIYREIYALMEDDSVSAEDIDKVAKYMFGPRMAVTGLLLQKDCSGLDTHTFAQREMVKVLANNRVCGSALENKFKKGEYGLKSGKGFYDWSGTGDPNDVQNEVNQRLIKLFNFFV
jgi:3-hydroxybutyryl-CoA dehydrogenase